jgi:PAS domain S-box-containing protein
MEDINMNKVQETNEILTILSLEDSTVDFDLILENLIGAGFSVRMNRVETEKEYLSCISSQSYDLILADYNLPSYDAFEALAQKNKICPQVPFICVSGSIGEDMAIELLKQGAVDYVLKRRLERLPLAIKRAIEEKNKKEALKHAEEELIKKEAKFRTLTENIPDIIARFDKNLKHIYINPAIEKVTGIHPKDYIGKTNQELGMPEDKTAVWNEQLQYVFQTSEQRIYEFDFQTPGGPGYFLSILVPELGEDGKVNTILSITRDVSMQKRAEIELTKSEERLRDILFSTADWVWEIDENGLYTYSSVKGNELFETSQEDIIGKSPLNFMPPEEAERIGQIFTEHIARRAPIINLENWNIAKNGNRICLLTNGVPIIDKDGKFRGYRGVDINITERKLAEETLRQSEAELNFSQEIANMGSWEYNLVSQRMKWSRNMFKLLGMNPNEKEFSFEHLLLLVHPDDRYLLGTLSKNLDNESESITFDFRYLLDNGRILWVQTNIFKVFENNIPIELHGVNIDITEKKQIEQELLLAKEKAEASNKLKTAFLNNISHEIRTPLNGILGFAPLIIDPLSTQEEKENFLEILNFSSKRLMQTVTDYMDASLIASGNIEPRKKIFAPDEVLNEIKKDFLPLFRAKGLEFSIEKSFAFKDVKLNSDQSLLKKILGHLIDNALKFTQLGRILLTATVNGDNLEIAVKDSGAGIRKDVMDEVFKHFVQEETSNTRGHEGSGLGLSIVKGLITLLGGTIHADSVKGIGSTFTIIIPGISTIGENYAKPANVQLKYDNNTPMILVAEDDPSSYLYIELMLHNSYRILRAEEGQDAVNMCKTIPEIQLVLMDIKMPGMNGLEATQIIKKFRKDLPIIALTAYAEIGMRDKCLDAGCDDYIPKPVEKAHLLSVLSKFGFNSKPDKDI